MRTCFAALFGLGLEIGASAAPFQIDIIDAESGWPVPLVEVETTHSVRLVSDNAGRIAFDLPELMGVETWLTVRGHGYEVKKDGFGFSGVRVTPRPGEKTSIRVNRTLPGKRIGRLTGAGLFAESQKLGLETDWKESGVLGCDSVQSVIHHGKVHWAWGDTILAHYPLGLFQMMGATTGLNPFPSLEPPLRPAYDFYRDEKTGRVRNTAEIPGSGPTWLSGYASLKDSQGAGQLVATYVKVKPPLAIYETGLCLWSETAGRFEPHTVLWNDEKDGGKSPNTPDGHPVRWSDEQGKSWLLFGDPFPDLKCPDSYEGWADLNRWVDLEPQAKVPRRDGAGEVKPHRGSISWNEFRKRWVTIFTQMNGESSVIGEIWYAEADAPTGPWENAVNVVTHDNYTFYNPKIHSGYVDPNSSVLLFEATYTREFAKHAVATARYNYNQILYRIDLDDPALVGAD